MPVWFELAVTMLAAYGAGIAIGWVLWGRRADTTHEDSE
jgi:hypothetical protein